jgi:hypothetical protein
VTRRARVMASVWAVLIVELLYGDPGACRTQDKKPRDPGLTAASSQNHQLLPKLHDIWNAGLIGAVNTSRCTHRTA